MLKMLIADMLIRWRLSFWFEYFLLLLLFKELYLHTMHFFFRARLWSIFTYSSRTQAFCHWTVRIFFRCLFIYSCFQPDFSFFFSRICLQYRGTFPSSFNWLFLYWYPVFFFFQGTSTPHFRTHYQDKLLLNCYLESFFPHANFDILLHCTIFLYIFFWQSNPQIPMKTLGWILVLSLLIVIIIKPIPIYELATWTIRFTRLSITWSRVNPLFVSTISKRPSATHMVDQSAFGKSATKLGRHSDNIKCLTSLDMISQSISNDICFTHPILYIKNFTC